MKKHFVLLFLMAAGTAWSMEDPNENKWPEKKGLDPYTTEEAEYSVFPDLQGMEKYYRDMFLQLVDYENALLNERAQATDLAEIKRLDDEIKRVKDLWGPIIDEYSRWMSRATIYRDQK